MQANGVIPRRSRFYQPPTSHRPKSFENGDSAYQQRESLGCFVFTWSQKHVKLLSPPLPFSARHFRKHNCRLVRVKPSNGHTRRETIVEREDELSNRTLDDRVSLRRTGRLSGCSSQHSPAALTDTPKKRKDWVCRKAVSFFFFSSVFRYALYPCFFFSSPSQSWKLFPNEETTLNGYGRQANRGICLLVTRPVIFRDKACVPPRPSHALSRDWGF